MATFYSGTEIIDLAKQIEAAGEAFYDAALAHLKDRRIRELFAHLRDEERRHGELFERMLADIADTGADEWRADEEYLAYMRALADNRVFPDAEAARTAVANLGSEEDAITFALGFEKDSILFLTGLLAMVEPAGRDAIQRLVLEEQRHVNRLNALLQRVRAASS